MKDEKLFYWYQASIQFLFEDEKTGKIKKVKETYLIKAVSITDAETQIVNDLASTTFDYRILNITESKVTRIVKPDNQELN